MMTLLPIWWNARVKDSPMPPVPPKRRIVDIEEVMVDCLMSLDFALFHTVKEVGVEGLMGVVKVEMSELEASLSPIYTFTTAFYTSLS